MTPLAHSHFIKASAMYREGMAAAAIKELQQAIVVDRRFVKAHLALATIHEARKDYARAMAAYQEVIHIDPTNGWANLRLGVLLNNLGRHKEALEPLKTAWYNDRGSAQTATAMAKALQATGDAETAELMYEEAIKLDPSLTDPVYNLAALRFNNARYESAIALYDEYISKGGVSSRAYRNTGKAFVHLGDLDAGIQNYQKALELAPDDATVYYNLARAFTLKDDYDSAIQSYNLALAISPDYIEARYNLAKCLRRRGRVREAAAEFERVLAQSPEYYRAMNGLGNCYINQHVYEKALELLLRAIGIAPDYPLAHYNAGIALQNMNKLEEALFHFRESLRLNPEDLLAKSALENVMSRLGLDPHMYELLAVGQTQKRRAA